MTWAQLDALLDRKYKQELRTFGRICAVQANFAPFVDKKQGFEPEDFFPDYRTLRKKNGQDVDQQIKFLSLLMGCGPEKPGTVH